MIYEDIQVSGSISVSGSFTIPVFATTASANQSTGSLFFDSTAKLFKVFQSGAGAIVTSNQPFTPSPPAAKGDIEYLVIGGGGSGGQLGGGGAGGHLSGSFAQVTSGSSLTVTVGGGGSPITSVVRGNTGTDSSIAVTGYTTATALGGGGGGGQGAASDAGTGKDGGSGGGGGENDAGTNTPGSGTAGQGNDGGTGGTGAGTQLSGGGGGGAGAVGSDAPGQSSGGAGGNGLANKITGTSTTRAGGGGGGAWYYNNGGSSYGGAGGSGGGGAAGTTGNTAAVSGTANTGGGGGGAGFTSAGWWITDSGTGGSGVAILAYPTGSLKSKGGNRKYFDDRVAHIFNSSGTLAVGSGTHTYNTKDVFGDSSCLALYQFEDNVNDIAGTYTGTAYNMTYIQGYINKSAIFNGSNGYVDSGFTAPTATESSISFWVNIAAYTNYGGFVGDSTGTGNHVRFFLGQGSGTSGNLWVSVANGSSNWYDDTTVSLSSYGLDTWFHICGTVSGTAVKIYINGSLVQSFTSTVSYVGGGQYPYYFGGWGGSLFLNGQMDQVRFFNKALSASEVATLYNE